MKTAKDFLFTILSDIKEDSKAEYLCNNPEELAYHTETIKEYVKQLLEEYTNRIVENAKVIENRSLSGMRVGSFSIDKESITSQLEIFKKEMGL